MKGDMLQSSIPKDSLVEVHHGVWVVHPSSLGRGEQVRVAGVLFVLLDQEVHRLLWDGDFPDGRLRLGAGDLELMVYDGCLFGHRDRFALHIQVAPEEGDQLAFSYSADQLQEEHRQYAALVSSMEVCAEAFSREDLDLALLEFGDDTLVCWIAWDEPFLHRTAQAAVKHRVDTPDIGAAEAGVLCLLRFTDAPMVFEVIIQLLDSPSSQLVQFDVSDLWNDVVVDEALVVGRC